MSSAVNAVAGRGRFRLAGPAFEDAPAEALARAELGPLERLDHLDHLDRLDRLDRGRAAAVSPRSVGSRAAVEDAGAALHFRHLGPPGCGCGGNTLSSAVNGVASRGRFRLAGRPFEDAPAEAPARAELDHLDRLDRLDHLDPGRAAEVSPRSV
jgi:hypothetical protein